MSIQDLINSHQHELVAIKAQMFDAEKRVKEIELILASLKKANEVVEASKNKEKE